MCLGSATVTTYCKGQAVPALSSGESEFYGLVSATAATLGLLSILKDWGWKLNVQVLMDATAGIALGSRRGLGKLKHIDTAYMWVQQVYNEGKLKLAKRDTKEMLADFLTKAVDEATMLRCTKGLNMYYKAGEHRMPLRA